MNKPNSDTITNEPNNNEASGEPNDAPGMPKTRVVCAVRHYFSGKMSFIRDVDPQSSRAYGARRAHRGPS